MGLKDCGHVFYLSSSFLPPHQKKALRGVQWVEMTSHGSDLFLAVVSRGFRGDTTGKIIVYW